MFLTMWDPIYIPLAPLSVNGMGWGQPGQLGELKSGAKLHQCTPLPTPLQLAPKFTPWQEMDFEGMSEPDMEALVLSSLNWARYLGIPQPIPHIGNGKGTS